MSLVAGIKPVTSSYGTRVYRRTRGISSYWEMVSSKSTPASRGKNISRLLHDPYDVPEIDKFSPPRIKFDRLQQTNQVATPGDTLQFGQFVAREARFEEEHWTAAWLRAETHCEGREYDRFADSHKQKFAEQEFNAMKTRYNAQLGEMCKCIVTVNIEDDDVKPAISNSVVGTLDFSIRYFSHGETFPGERVKAPFFCLIDRKASSRYGYISNLCVASSARRQGVASNMLQFVILAAKMHGVEKVFVHVYRDNKPAQDLYQKIGFEVVDAANSQLSADQTYLLCLELQSSDYLQDIQFPLNN